MFVAAWPPHDVTETLGNLARPQIAGLRWTEPGQHHVTLVFLGEVAGSQAEPLAKALRGWADGAAPANATAGPITERLGVRVLCAPVRGLDALAQGVRSATAGFGDALDDYPFFGHLTLARAGGRGRIPDELVGMPVAADWEVGEVRLVASTLEPWGPRYEPLELARLGG